jgi:beta-N-acetylhexosaminidase
MTRVSRRSPAATIASRLPTPQLIAQLFVVGVHGTTASRGTLGSLRRHGWDGVVLTPANWAGPRFAKQLTAELAGAARAARRLPPLVGVSQGSAAGDPETEPASVGQSLAELRARDLRPFAAVAHTAPVVVASNAIYAAFDGATPAVLLPQALTGLLRQRMGFRGVVMSDDLLAASTTNHADVGAAAVRALLAGADLL